MKVLRRGFANLMVFVLSPVILVALFLLYQYVYVESKLLDLIIQVYGAFVATLLGVYISLNLSKKQEHERDKKSIQQTMLGSLKIVWAELDINEDILKNLHDGLEGMPRNANQLYNQNSLLIEYCRALSNKAFYATMSSGAINIIVNHQDIFNDLQQAYYNLNLTQNGLSISNQTYKDLASPVFANSNPLLCVKAFEMLDQEAQKVERTIAMIVRAKKSAFDYLSSKGVTFTREEMQQQKGLKGKNK